MGKVTKIFSLITIGLVLLTLINRHIQKQKDPTIFKIFQASDHESILLRVIGIVPRKFKEIYASEIIESGEKFYLKKIYRTSKVPLEVGYLLGINGNEDFIFSFLYPLKNNQDLRGINLENHLNYLFDLEVFNKYLELFEIKDPEKIKFKLAFFHSDGIDFKRIESFGELKKLRVRYESIYEEIPDSIEFELKQRILNFDKFEYYWYPRKGLIQFKIEIENGKVEEFYSVFIGLMGLDLLPM
jgi:hypothetical protein